MTPLEWPVWWAAIRGSRSSTATRSPSWRSASSRATASPTIPAPTTTTSHSLGDGSGRHRHACETQPRGPAAQAPDRAAAGALAQADPRRARGGPTSPSTTASARSPSSTGTSCSCSRAAAGRWRATSPSSSFPAGPIRDRRRAADPRRGRREVFDALQNRLHPAESRVKMLAEETPALFRAFDLLAVGDRRSCSKQPFERAARGAGALVDGFDDPRLGRADAAGRRRRPRPSHGWSRARA